MQSDVSVLSKTTSTAIKLKMAQINGQDYENVYVTHSTYQEAY